MSVCVYRFLSATANGFSKARVGRGEDKEKEGAAGRGPDGADVQQRWHDDGVGGA